MVVISEDSKQQHLVYFRILNIFKIQYNNLAYIVYKFKVYNGMDKIRSADQTAQFCKKDQADRILLNETNW